MERIFVAYGKIVEDDLEFQIYHLDGSAHESNFVGHVWGAWNETSFLIKPSHDSEYLVEYRVSKYATKESIEFKQGYKHGLAQKRMRKPSSGMSADFYRGWHKAYCERKGL